VFVCYVHALYVSSHLMVLFYTSSRVLVFAMVGRWVGDLVERSHEFMKGEKFHGNALISRKKTDKN
jgi:hypothetical protein